MISNGYLLSSANPLATTDQRQVEDTALQVLTRPELAKARASISFLWREVMEQDTAYHMSRFEGMLDDYLFHNVLRAVLSDTSRPKVARFMAPPHHWFGRDVPGSRWAGDSPDFIYRIITAGHGGRYEIRGRSTCANPPTVNYALMSDNTAAPTILGLLDGRDIRTEADGEFNITIDASPANGRTNHIQTRLGAQHIWVRDAIGDWIEQSANVLEIHRLDAHEREPLTEEELAQRAARNAVDGLYYAYFCMRATTAMPVNQLIGPASSAPLGGMATQRTCRANIYLRSDEAMVVTSTAAGALFRNAVLADHFMISLDYWKRTSSLNMDQMAPDEDGKFTCVIAHEDPGVHNWLDTEGLERTIFGQRWQAFSKDSSDEPTITGRVVKFRDLDKALPRGIRRIDSAGRAAQLAARATGFKKRFIDR